MNSKGKKKRLVNTTSKEICPLHLFSHVDIRHLQTQILHWYELNKRDLPWRRRGAQEEDRNCRGYAIWVSEVMLQQTQVATVIKYYNKWMDCWPTMQDLSQASLEEVNKIWAGLGYYSRAKRLHEACKKVINEMNGELPMDAEGLMKFLPGVGKYTAAAISSIAFNESVGLVDGNVIRVLSRLRIIGADSSSSVAMEIFWKLAGDLVSKDQPGNFNQAMMELGATICTPKSPDCPKCPIKGMCLAYRQSPKFQRKITNFTNSHKQLSQHFNVTDIEDTFTSEEDTYFTNNCELCLSKDSFNSELGVCNYPKKVKRKEVRKETLVVCILEVYYSGETHLLLIKRPENGMLPGLWEFPNFITEKVPPYKNEIKKFMNEHFERKDVSINERNAKFLGVVHHLFSHKQHTYNLYKIAIVTKSELPILKSVNGLETKWVNEKTFEVSAISTAMKKVYLFYKNGGEVKKMSRKRKRVTENPTKKQEILDAYCVKT